MKEQKSKKTWGGARKGAGRKPTGKPSRKQQIAIRLTQDEKEFLEGLARHEEMTLSEYFRMRLLGKIEEE